MSRAHGPEGSRSRDAGRLPSGGVVSSTASSTPEREAARLRVDWPACHGRGLCAELVPELVALDEWGYPIVEASVPRLLVRLAAEAVDACPHRALRLVDPPATP